MQIDREPIARETMASLVERIRPTVDETPDITTFEVTTALAFLYFQLEEVDLAVMEVGLGGRLDATNVILPEISIITSLSLDHTDLLGDTLAEIAAEKGGIIKQNVPVVSAPQEASALEVLENIAEAHNAPISVVGRDWTWDARERRLQSQIVDIRHHPDPSSFDGTYEIGLIGNFQQENATVAVAAAATLNQSGHDWATPDTIREGLRHASWPGRLEVLNANPPVVVDSAHNPYSTGALVDSLQTWFPTTRWLLIYGASNDKDIEGMLKTLIPHSEHVIVTRSYHPRAAAPYALADLCAEVGHGAEIAVDPARALEQAWTQLEPTMGIIATGSIFLVADIREAWSNKNGTIALPKGDWVDEPWKPVANQDR
jgi:dihydrofolate synthase/folylpolyglutamate synthase